jgi:CRP/FNR family transcriptional regulator, cyclic AMP receptor protein
MEFVNRMMDAFEDLKDAIPKPVVSGFRMPQDEKMERLATVPILQECTGRQLREVARITEVMEAPEGTVITRVGEPGDEFFMIVDGTARVEVPGGATRELVPGEFFGEMSLLDLGPRSATVTAVTGIRLLVIKRRHFTTLLKEAPALAYKILTILARRVRDLERSLSGSASRD